MFDIDFWLIIAQIINFLIIFFIFKKFVSDSMNDLVEDRKALLDKLERADSYYNEKKLEAEKQELDILNQAHSEAKKFMSQTEDIASKKAKDLIDKANKEVMYILDWWKRQVEKERLTMLETMKTKIFDLSLKLNQKIFNDDDLAKKFIEDNVEKEVI